MNKPPMQKDLSQSLGSEMKGEIAKQLNELNEDTRNSLDSPAFIDIVLRANEQVINFYRECVMLDCDLERIFPKLDAIAVQTRIRNGEWLEKNVPVFLMLSELPSSRWELVHRAMPKELSDRREIARESIREARNTLEVYSQNHEEISVFKAKFQALIEEAVQALFDLIQIHEEFELFLCHHRDNHVRTQMSSINLPQSMQVKEAQSNIANNVTQEKNQTIANSQNEIDLIEDELKGQSLKLYIILKQQRWTSFDTLLGDENLWRSYDNTDDSTVKRALKTLQKKLNHFGTVAVEISAVHRRARLVT
jgi:hypothetical protein